MPTFSKGIQTCEMKTATFWIWTRIAESTSSDNGIWLSSHPVRMRQKVIFIGDWGHARTETHVWPSQQKVLDPFPIPGIGAHRASSYEISLVKQVLPGRDDPLELGDSVQQLPLGAKTRLDTQWFLWRYLLRYECFHLSHRSLKEKSSDLLW